MNIIEGSKIMLDDLLMNPDPNVLFGEDVGYFGGVFRVTDGLQKRNMENINGVFDTPLAEGGIASMAMGIRTKWTKAGSRNSICRL